MKICFLDSKTMGADIDLSPLNKLGELTSYETTAYEEVPGRIQGMDIIINNKVILDENVLSTNKSIGLIALTSTGSNVVDLDYAKQNNIAVTNVSGYSTQNVVQHTFALALSLMGSINDYDRYVKTGRYASSDMFTYYGRPINELYGKTWGIIGLGEIGREVAKISEAFGCRVIYYSTSGKNQNSSYKSVSLEELLTNSDIISIHAPLNENTKNLLNRENIVKMKKSAIIINVARGGIVNESDLALALNENLIAGAGLDVLEYEPIKENNPLLAVNDLNKLIITPHIAWASVEARTRLLNEVCLNIKAFIDGEKRNRII